MISDTLFDVFDQEYYLRQGERLKRHMQTLQEINEQMKQHIKTLSGGIEFKQVFQMGCKYTEYQKEFKSSCNLIQKYYLSARFTDDQQLMNKLKDALKSSIFINKLIQDFGLLIQPISQTGHVRVYNFNDSQSYNKIEYEFEFANYHAIVNLKNSCLVAGGSYDYSKYQTKAREIFIDSTFNERQGMLMGRSDFCLNLFVNQEGSNNLAKTVISNNYLKDDSNIFVFATGGYNGNYMNECEIFDYKLNRWSQIPSLNTRRADHTACVIGGGRRLLYVFCGWDGNYLSSIQRLDFQNFDKYPLICNEKILEHQNYNEEQKDRNPKWEIVNFSYPQWQPRYWLTAAPYGFNKIIIFGNHPTPTTFILQLNDEFDTQFDRASERIGSDFRDNQRGILGNGSQLQQNKVGQSINDGWADDGNDYNSKKSKIKEYQSDNQFENQYADKEVQVSERIHQQFIIRQFIQEGVDCKYYNAWKIVSKEIYAIDKQSNMWKFQDLKWHNMNPIVLYQVGGKEIASIPIQEGSNISMNKFQKTFQSKKSLEGAWGFKGMSTNQDFNKTAYSTSSAFALSQRPLVARNLQDFIKNNQNLITKSFGQRTRPASALTGGLKRDLRDQFAMIGSEDEF